MPELLNGNGGIDMCEANVYINRNGQEELLMESVDRIIPGEDNSVFLESIFGERKVVKARIKEMELVHHRVVLDEIREETATTRDAEIWLEPDTNHGHFHAGEEVCLKILKGYNMRSDGSQDFQYLQAFADNEGAVSEIAIKDHHGAMEINLGQEADGLIQVYVKESRPRPIYAKILVEIGHHHHHGLKPLGLPLELMPCDYTHARMGESYEVQVLKDGQPLPGIEVKATYAGTRNKDYPHRMISNAEGKVKLFLTARGNYLFSVQDEQTISTFTLVKSF